MVKKAGLKGGPLRLQQGTDRVLPDGSHKGFGKIHIEARHLQEIRDAGYASVEAFVSDLGKNFYQVWWNGGSRLVVVAKTAGRNESVVGLRSEGEGFYCFISAFRKREGIESTVN